MTRLLPIFGNFRVLDDFGLDRIWTCETEFEQFWCQLSRVLHLFYFCCMACLWVSYARRPLWSVLQSCEELCIHWQLDLSEFLHVTTSLHYFLLSETSKCKWPRITCQDVRHASWGNSECDLYRKCESSIKVWGTHLRMNEREREMDSCFLW